MKRRLAFHLACLPVAVLGIAVLLLFRVHAPERQPIPSFYPSDVPEIVDLRPLVKDHLALELMEGRRSLPEVACLFEALDQILPAPRHFPPQNEQGDVHTDQHFRDVIVWVGKLKDNDPAKPTILARLESELMEITRQGNTFDFDDTLIGEQIDSLLAFARSQLRFPRK